jgi:cytochrome c
MRLLGKVVWATALAATTSALLARVHPFGDAGLYASAAMQQRIPEQAALPANVRALLVAKCADCHSSQTRAPLYARFAPMSWLMERDIMEARKQMNLSNWASYSADQQDTLKSKILQQAKSGAMPVIQYRMIHWSTRITPADLGTLTTWAYGTATTDAPTHALQTGDPIRGKAVFEKRCTGCHALESNREGPRLQGVFGRPTASIGGFPYSTALMKVHGVWNEQSLDKWLTDPDSFVAGGNMDFRVPNPQERKDLISFFAQAARH